MRNWFADLRYAARSALKRPGYSLITIVVLTIAIGANSVIFSLLNAYVLRPLPYPDSDRLVSIANVYTRLGLDSAYVSIPDYLDRRDQAPSLDSIAVYNVGRRLLNDDGRSEQLLVTRASPSLFDVLETGPAVGRLFSDSEAVPGQDRVAVLSNRFWKDRYGGRADLVGTDIRLDGEPFRVVGVMPEGFGFPNDNVDAWVPFAFTPAQASDAERGMEYSLSIGRLADHATIAGLDAEMDAIVRSNVEENRERDQIESVGFTGRAQSLQSAVTGDISVLLYLLQGLVLAVLLIACANIANLQLARIASRRQELSIRLALGASKGRLARLVLSESFVLSLAGAALGLALSYPAVAVIQQFVPMRAGPGAKVGIDGSVLAFTMAATALATLVTGFFPLAAIRRDDLSRAVRDAARAGVGRAANRFRGALVVFQIAASVALLFSAGLLTKSFFNLAAADPGFDRSNVWEAGIVLPRDRYQDGQSVVGFYHQTLEALAALPGVSEAGFTSNLPFVGLNSEASYEIDGYVPVSDAAPPHAQQRSISEGFLPSLGVPILQGRNFIQNETEPVAIVDDLFVRRYFPDGNVLGRRIRLSVPQDSEWSTIVGVVPVVQHEALGTAPTKETIYWHYAQRPFAGGQIVLRTSLPPDQLTPVVAATVAKVDAEVLVAGAMSMDALVLRSIGQESAAMSLTIGFAFGALALAVLGIYGVMTWSVTQRAGEIGVRMALGAQRSDVMGMVLRQSGRLVALGLAFGIGLAAALAAVLSSQVYEVSAADPGVFVSTIGSILLVAFAASWLPARRAARVDPMKALREA